MLEPTRERFLPWSGDPQSSYEHLHRYALATHFARDKKVLDLACGEGYGSLMLAQHADHVTGIEIDQATVAHARNTYPRENLEFVTGSITDVPLSGVAKFDVIVCFEALEHIENHEKLLSEVKRLLKDGGLFFVSTPNKSIYTDDSGFHNPCHVKELHFSEFKALIGKHFTDVQFWGQRVFSGSNIWDISLSDEPRYVEFVIDKTSDQFYFVERQSKPPLFYLALASNRPLQPHEADINSWLVDVSFSFGQDFHKLIADLRNAIHSKYAQAPETGSPLQARDTQTAEPADAPHAGTKATQEEPATRQESTTQHPSTGHDRPADSIPAAGTKESRFCALGRIGIRVLMREGPVALLRKSWRRIRRRPAVRT